MAPRPVEESATSKFMLDRYTWFDASPSALSTVSEDADFRNPSSKDVSGSMKESLMAEK